MKLFATTGRVLSCAFIMLAVQGYGNSPNEQETKASSSVLASRPTAGPIRPGDWASYNYGSNGWRWNDHERILNPQSIDRLELKWKFPRDGGSEKCGVIHATPAVVDGFVYFGTATEPKFYCLTPQGRVAWSYDLTEQRRQRGRGRSLDDSSGHLNPENGIYVSALVTETGVYFGDAAGVMYGLDRVSGQELWVVDSHAGDFPGAHRANIVMGSPTLVQDKVVFGGGAFEHAGGVIPNYECCSGCGFVIAIDLKSGHIVWKYNVGPQPQKYDPPYVETDAQGEHVFHYGPSTSSVWSPPSFNPDNGLVFFGTDIHNSPRKPTTDDPRNYTEHSAAVIAVDASDGSERWISQINPGDVWNYSRPVYDDERKVYKDQSIGDTPKVYSIQIDGVDTPVVGAGCKNGGYYVMDQRDGRILHHTPLYSEPPNDDPRPDPRVLALPGVMGGLQTGCATDGQRVYANGIDNFPTLKRPQVPTGGRVTAISLDTTSEVWRHERPKIPWMGGTRDKPQLTNVGDPVLAGISLAGGLAFFNTVSSNKLVCLDTQSGQVLKEISIGPVLSSPSISHGKVYVGTGNSLFGSVFMPNSKTGQLLVFGLRETASK